MPDNIRIGIAGWQFGPWKNNFYPAGLRAADELAYASRHLNFDEINGTLYSLQKPSTFKAWHDATPDDFVFAVKGHQTITMYRRLRDVEQPLANFFASGVLALGKKLGPMLWQLPPTLKFDPALLEAFFDLLPRDTEAAAKMAKSHDEKVKPENAPTKAPVDQPLRHAIEARHPSYKTPEFIKLLRKHKIALVAASAANKYPTIEDVTADFVYIRLHGNEATYAKGYTDKDMAGWADKIRAWSTGKEPAKAKCLADPMKKPPKSRDVFCVFNNTMKDRAPLHSMTLAEELGVPTGEKRAALFDPIEIKKPTAKRKRPPSK